MRQRVLWYLASQYDESGSFRNPLGRRLGGGSSIGRLRNRVAVVAEPLFRRIAARNGAAQIRLTGPYAL